MCIEWQIVRDKNGSLTHTMVFEFEYVYVANLFEDVGHLHFMDKKTFSAY